MCDVERGRPPWNREHGSTERRRPRSATAVFVLYPYGVGAQFHYDDGVVEQQLPRRVSGPTRVVGLLVLLFAVAAMHAGVFATGPGPGHHSPGHHSVVATPADPHSATASGDHGFVHGARHGCVFILSAAFAFGLVLLYRLVTTSLPDGHLPTSLRWRIRRERPPPWTVLSLAELSILRI